MARRQTPERMFLQLDPGLTARVRRYHRDSGILGSEQDAARELIAAALDAPEIESSLIRSARQRAFLTVRRTLMERVQMAVADLERFFRRDVGVEGGGDGDDGEQATG